MAHVKTFWPPLLLMGLIFVLSSIPGDAEDTLDFVMMINPNVQNILHIPLFGALQFLWLRAFAKTGWVGYGAAFTALAVTFSYGFIDEYHQTFVAGRYASLGDVCLNFAGVLVGTGLFVFVRRQSLA